MLSRRALVALWIGCAGVIAFVWLRPLHDGPLPPPVARAPRPARHVVDPARAPLGQPEDEPAAEEPAAAPIASGPPELLRRQDLEGAMLKLRPRVLACREVEQLTGILTVHLVIARSGSVQSLQVQPPLAETRTAECVKRVLRGLSFPRFAGTWSPTIEWSYPFLFDDHPLPPAAAQPR